MDTELHASDCTESAERLTLIAVDGAQGGEAGLLTYLVPQRWLNRTAPGQLVWVPLRKKLALGIVIEILPGSAPAPSFTARPIEALVEPVFRLDPEALDLGAWIAREMASSRFAALAPFLPPGVSNRAVKHLRLFVEPDAIDLATLTPAQLRLVRHLEERGETSLEVAQRALGSSLRTVIAKLEERDVIEVVAKMVHHAPSVRSERSLRLIAAENVTATLDSAPKQRAIVTYLERRNRLTADRQPAVVAVGDVLEQTGSSHATIGALVRKGIIEETWDPAAREDAPVPVGAPALTADQAQVWERVQDALHRRDPTPFLLHGVTGSGKTEIYLRAVAWCLRHGRGAHVLVPEIGLASQVVRRFQERFPRQVVVLHSALPDGERYENWLRLQRGDASVVVGPRSALFAPVQNPGLIILDEEHESSYKQDTEPRYHARALAEQMAARTGAVLVLGSATPAIETFYRTEEGTAKLLTLKDRVGAAGVTASASGARQPLELPPVEVVDMRLELHRGNTAHLSKRLCDTLEQTLARQEQAILFLNRRGLATIVLCRGCGERLICPHCDIPMVYHGDRRRLLCHRCNWRQSPPGACPACGGVLNYFGAGTQRIEDEVRQLFPGSRVLRMDQDAVRRQGGHARLLGQVERHEVDILVGTQMIAKGLDLPRVTAVGVIHADSLLHLPDFRSSERTFQLLTQVAGRAGRRAAGSSVIVQSYTPEHYAIRAAAKHDYTAFYAEEIDFRRMHRFPPFARLIRFIYRDQDEARCAAQAEAMARRLARHAYGAGMSDEIDLLGPTPAFASRVRGRYQWQIVLRASRIEPLLKDLPAPPGWTVDVDPQQML
ncbi:MAG: replication restart helicase PriA [Thermomicrobiales bacterium]